MAVSSPLGRTRSPERTKFFVSLQSHEDDILCLWERQVREGLPPTVHQTSTALGESIPEILKEFDRAIDLKALGSTQGKVTNRPLQSQLRILNYPIDQILFEFRVLRKSILSVFKEGGLFLSFEDLEIFLEFFDQIVDETASDYTRLQNALKEQERRKVNILLERVQLLFQYADWGMAIDNPEDSSILAVNPAFAMMHGYENAEDLVGKPIDLFYAPEELAKLSLPMKIAGEQGHHRFESLHIRKDGTRFCVLTDLIALKDETGKIVFRAANFQDITESKETEEEKARFLALSRNDLDRLKQEREIRERFVTTLSHDLRNPLTVVKANAQLMLHYSDRPEIRERAIRKIISAIDRADKMIQDLLDANRIRAGQKLPVHISPCELRGILSDVREELNLIYDDRIKLTPSSPLHGYWDESAVRRVVENLVVNAVKYGYPDTPILLSLSCDQDQAEIKVHNEGVGLTFEEKSAIFEAFHRTKTARTGIQKGWGLGLTLVRGIADAHGGRVRLESAEGVGTTFCVELPLDARKCDVSQDSEQAAIYS